MTLYALLIYAVTSSTAMSDSERMARQLQRQEVFAAPQVQAPVDPYAHYSRLVLDCGKRPN
jgi:hypothetical protein